VVDQPVDRERGEDGRVCYDDGGAMLSGLHG